LSKYLIVLLTMLLLVSGCQRQADKAAAGGQVKASDVYRSWFGEPPAVSEGTAWAVTGFFPLAAQADRVMPVPLFLFTPDNQPQLLLGKVMQGGAYLSLPQLASNPFPTGTVLRAVTVHEGLATADFSSELLQISDPVVQQGVLAAIGHTLVQFADIERVQVTVEGQPLPFVSPGQLPVDSAAVVEPGPPALLQALLHEDDDAVPGEVVVFFNRPMRLKSFRLEFPRGEQVAGQYFTSVFDMAIILHPDDPNRMQVGSEVFINWQVTDMLGREGGGQSSLFLGRMAHD
jgi:hypothetical protein